MFKREVSATMAYSADKETIIAQGVRVEGDFTSSGSVSIDGEVTGSVQTAQALRVGDTAKIHANVTADSAVVAGEIKGDIKIGNTLEILETAVIEGDVDANVLSVAAGAKINGRITMGGAKGKRSETEE
jgi:cytoskeletal protein CcmA (bactofilin family)